MLSPDRRPLPDWPLLHRELKRPGVTLSLLWEEYRAVHRDGYGYSRFCDLYRDWRGQLAPTMRQTHVAGDKLFVDYAGARADVIDGLTGEVRQAQIFVATLGASSYTYAEATWTQALPDWIGSHSRAFAYFGGVPRQVVPDNLKSGVVKACLYDPEVNRTYAGMAAHYDTAIVPTRPRKPRDKAKVEVGVQVVERWILARLRNRRFFSLAELNQAIGELLDDLNARRTKHLGASRRQLFEALDQPALKPLPGQPYQYAEWKQRRAGLDYHVEAAKHYYSVPHALAKQKLWVRITDRTVEVFHKGKRVAKGQGRAKGAAKPNLYDEMTARIIAELEAGRAPWVQPWGTSRAKAGLGLPKNALTGRAYSGVNVSRQRFWVSWRPDLLFRRILNRPGFPGGSIL